MFEFQIQNQDPNCAARTGEFILPRGKVKTPIFMPCGTKGMVKTMLPNELSDLGVELILGNTYHLHLRPGSELVAEKGGLPTWNRWEKPMLTDSGGSVLIWMVVAIFFHQKRLLKFNIIWGRIF
jgi:queuine tRNA-ribosyltransferase